VVDDESEGKAETWAFLDRRIEGIMRFEKAKRQFRPPIGSISARCACWGACVIRRAKATGQANRANRPSYCEPVAICGLLAARIMDAVEDHCVITLDNLPVGTIGPDCGGRLGRAGA
jgi:hypothetical protein